jgi:exonuclease III
MKKIAAILELQTLFIFLSDLRLNSDQTGNSDKLFSPHYKLYHNSKSSKRGVGILVSSKLHYDVIGVYNDAHDNILGLKLQVGTEIILLISIYGPNLNQVEFFNDLRRILTENKNIYTVCAGDWNLTYSTTDSVENIDILNMKSPPSVFRSRLLAGICEDLGFMDPFRMLHYDKKEFTYVPRHGGRNRSRIDFFLNI